MVSRTRERVGRTAHIALWSLLALSLGQGDEALGQGTLGQIRQDVRAADASPPPPKREQEADDEERKKKEKRKRWRRSAVRSGEGPIYFDDKPCPPCDRYSDSSDCDEGDTYGLGEAFGLALVSPIMVPRLIADDDWDTRGYFPRFPYDGGHDGYLMESPEFPSVPFNWSLFAEIHHGTDFDRLTRTGGRLLFDTVQRIGFDAEANRWQEDLVDRDDSLWLGDANFVWRFAQSPRFLWRTGIGLTWLSDSFDTDFGFNFTYGGEWFPCEPLIASATIDWGLLRSAGLFHAQATLGAHFYGCEVFVGGDYLDIGSTQIATLLAGLRLRQ